MEISTIICRSRKRRVFYVKVVFRSKANTFHLSVHNNVEISKKEQMRVYDRIARSRAFESLEEAFSTVLDDSEGAGLGLVILVLMLKKIGLTEDSFDIDAQNGETVARISIPFGEVHMETLEAPHAADRPGNRPPAPVSRQHRFYTTAYKRS